MHTLHFNGIEGATGSYLLPPMSVGRFAEKVREQRIHPSGRAKGVISGIDATSPDEAGWGVVFPQDVESSVKHALHDLLEHRRSSKHFRTMTYLPGESALSFLARQGAAPGPVVPERFPYYLLIVGGPESIPFAVQEDLDVQYAVGRLALETPEEYARYARGVLTAESRALRRRRAAFFGAENPDDPATELSAKKLVRPLAMRLAGSLPGWEVAHFSGAAATKAQLHAELHGEDRPAFLFTAGHAVYFSAGQSQLQRRRQGGLMMSDWPGPRWGRPIPRTQYFAAHDLEPEARVHGLVSFHFACFSGGTPRFDSFRENGGEPIATAPFVARLPQALLGHPAGGALAVIGHVDRALDTSFLWKDEVPQLAVFKSMFEELFAGCPVGYAMECFGQRYAELAVALHAEKLMAAEAPDDRCKDELTARLWAAYHDARGYVLLGDPAVRLATGDESCPDPSSTPS